MQSLAMDIGLNPRTDGQYYAPTCRLDPNYIFIPHFNWLGT